jgi:hypothetical protein
MFIVVVSQHPVTHVHVVDLSSSAGAKVSYIIRYQGITLTKKILEEHCLLLKIINKHRYLNNN